MLEQLLDVANGKIAPAREYLWKVISSVSWMPADNAMREEPPVLDGLWNQVGTLVGTALAERERIAGFQSAAAEHLDAAHYTLSRMLGELAAVMPILSRAEVPEVDVTPLRALLAAAEEQEMEAQELAALIASEKSRSAA